MGDPAEENDPPPESRRFLTKELQSVNWKNPKKVHCCPDFAHLSRCLESTVAVGGNVARVPALPFNP